MKFTDKYLKYCFYQCKKACDKSPRLRSKGYFENEETDLYNEKCLFTGWELSHFITHLIIGVFGFPNTTSAGISIGYEIYEQAQHNCGSIGDLIINQCGYMVGSYLCGVKTH